MRCFGTLFPTTLTEIVRELLFLDQVHIGLQTAVGILYKTIQVHTNSTNRLHKMPHQHWGDRTKQYIINSGNAVCVDE